MEDFASKFKVSKIVNPADYGKLPLAIRPNISKAEQTKLDAAAAASGGGPVNRPL
jgi:hypothetical protein